MAPAVQGELRLARVAGVFSLLASLVACGGSSAQSFPACDLNSAPEVSSVTVQNTNQESLHDYPVAISLDETVFDFAVPTQDGSGLAVWDATTHQPTPAWLESYDSVAGKGLLWVKLHELAPQASQTLLLTTGCSIPRFSGYSVFPFFSDVDDVNWRATNRLGVTNTAVEEPLTITSRSEIESDGMYNGFPGVAQAANGDFVLAYKKGHDHVNSPLVVLRRSSDGCATWSPEIVYWNSSQPDPALIRTPLGALLIAFGKANGRGLELGAYSRSSDNGLTWGGFTFFQANPVDIQGLVPSLSVGQVMHGAGYGTFGVGGDLPSLWSSGDDGLTWTRLSALREPGEPGLNETAIAYIAPNTIFAIMRTDNSLDTFGRYSHDMGITWGPLISYTSQVGVLQAPEMIQAGSALILMGRETIAIPGVTPLNTIAYPRQLVAFVSYDGGQTFGYGIVLDAYTGRQIDGGYSWPMLLPNGQVYVAYYGDSHSRELPVIKSVTLAVGPPSTHPIRSIHVLSQLAPGLATQALNLNMTRYSLEFRFRSNPTPAGSQFSVVLQGQTSGSPSRVVNWELPSTHASNPTTDSGIIANQQFVRVLNSFHYGQVYRLRTVVDEAQGTQEASALDVFGGLISAATPQALAQGTAHATEIQIGNNSNLRATDTLLDFVFVRPVAQTEPLVTVTRVH